MSTLEDYFREAVRLARNAVQLESGTACTWEVDWPGVPGVVALGAVDWRGRYSVVPTEAQMWGYLCRFEPERADMIRQHQMQALLVGSAVVALNPVSEGPHAIIEGQVVEP